MLDPGSGTPGLQICGATISSSQLGLVRQAVKFFTVLTGVLTAERAELVWAELLL